uniref:F-box domain-containing protein n=1 Tax=Fagus sylvatica TaxID=28930 RepID=A0A2N9HL07_FAGSY
MSESERLPHDVVYDILTRLAVKSLMRLRCVSKSCNSIIINPIFSSTHLDRAKSLSNKNGYLLYLDDASGNPPYRRELCTVVYNTLTEISRFQIPFSHVDIAGFYDGMFCLQNNRNNELYLWNPSIRKFKNLVPPRLTRRIESKNLVHGLAYHSQNNDFKVLRLVTYEVWAKAEVYTLSTDSWREVILRKVFSLCPLMSMMRHSGKIMLPQNYDVEFLTMFQQLEVFKGFLAFFVFGFNPNGYNGTKCNIWVMKEYGVLESWTKICLPVNYFGNFCGCTDNGELLYINDTKLVSLDPDSLNENIIAIEEVIWEGYTANSMESLVLLDGLNVSSEYED